MEALLKKMAAAADEEVAEATAEGNGKSKKDMVERLKEIEAKRANEALVKFNQMETLRKETKATREANQQALVLQEQKQYADKVRRAKEEAYAKKLEAIKNKTRKYFQLEPPPAFVTHESYQPIRKRIEPKDGVVYYGDHRDVGNCWQPHGWGQYKTKGGEVVIYEGMFYKGMMHGKGTYTFPNGDQWKGYFQRDKMHGCGVLYCMTEDGEKTKECIYQAHKRICFTEELLPGTRLRLHRYHCPREEVGTVIGPVCFYNPPFPSTEPKTKLGHYRVRLDEGNIQELDLGDTPFSIARDLPPLHLLDIVLRDTFAEKREGRGYIASTGPGRKGVDGGARERQEQQEAVRRSIYEVNMFRDEDESAVKRLQMERERKQQRTAINATKQKKEEVRRAEAKTKAQAKQEEEIKAALEEQKQKQAEEGREREEEAQALLEAQQQILLGTGGS